jgi:hypothetical protein
MKVSKAEQEFKDFIKNQNDLSYGTIESAFKAGWVAALKFRDGQIDDSCLYGGFDDDGLE